jgi:DNA-binding NarL/FixJ family response regulator
MKNKYTILLADDHSILRAGIRSILTSQNIFEVVDEVDNGKDALHKAIKLKPDMLITDLSMPKTNGTEAIREIKQRLPEIKILVLTMHSGDEHVYAALKSGADGYVLKDDDHDELMSAISNVLSGKKHLSPSICGSIINRFLNDSGDDDTPLSSWDILTHREREVLKLIAEGYRNKDIAEYLSISVKTVEKHRSNLMKKLDLHSISSLTNYAIQNNIVICD